MKKQQQNGKLKTQINTEKGVNELITTMYQHFGYIEILDNSRGELVTEFEETISDDCLLGLLTKDELETYLETFTIEKVFKLLDHDTWHSDIEMTRRYFTKYLFSEDNETKRLCLESKHLAPFMPKAIHTMNTLF